MTLSPRSQACTDAAMAVLSAHPGRVLCTGYVEDATGYGKRWGQLCYRMLDRLARLGLITRRGGRGDPGWASVHWQWQPSEGDCDTAWRIAPAECVPGGCMRPRGCQGCHFWAARNLRKVAGR